MTMTNPTPTQILAGMSEAQREAVASSIGRAEIFVIRLRHGRSAGVLERLGLVYKVPLAGGPRVLTPLGLQVRQLLQEQDNGND